MKWNHLLAMTILATPLVVASASAQQAAGQAGQAAAAAGQGQAAQGQGQGGGGRGGMGIGAPVGDEYSYPTGIAIGKSKIGPIFVDAKGNTLYQPNLRYLQYRAGGFGGGAVGNPMKFCSDKCTESWIAVAAPADAKPTGYWKVVEGSNGPQWAYKNSPVFTYVLDKGPGDLSGDGADELPTAQSQPQVWKAVAYIPPVPKVTAPGNVAPLFAGGEYMYADKQGHPLFACNKAGDASCTTAKPFYAGLAGQSMGDWSVVRDGDRAQWAFKGKLVYVSDQSQSANVPLADNVVPTETVILHP